jgi:phosphopentomutase
VYQTHAIYKWSGNVLQKAKIQYAALDALAGAIVGEQIYAISSDYKKTPPSIEEMQKCVVVQLLVENRNNVAAIGKIHQVTQKRDYEERKSFTEVKVKLSSF